jgi:hypothetical protein
VRRNLLWMGALGLVGLLLGCSDDGGPGQDSAPVVDTASSADKGPADDSTTGDAPVSIGDGGAVTCTKSNDTCQGGLTCQCCGSMGPAPICVCSTSCVSDKDCTRPNQPLCNKASPTAAAGICTPAAFNCCWMCQ